MTTGETEESVACGGQKKADGRIGGGGGGGNMKLSFTTLSTIAIQAGQSQIVVSVLRSGPVVHLQLVQVHPGLCEIGSNQEENQTLIQEQQQLMEKLKKHEREVLSVVEKSRQTEQRRRRRRDEGMMEQRRNKKQEEEEEGVHTAMEASLNEGWSLLLRLLERRQEVLTLASDFYRRAWEFAVSIDRFEDLQTRPDDDRQSEVQLTYDSMRRDLLGKSLQVLTSSSVLLQKVRQLQRTEALQRRGGVLQDKEEEEEKEEEKSSQRSTGMALKLEELVEALQDRRRRVDQAVRLQLRQAESGIMVYEKEQESRQAGSEDWSLTVDQILDQNLQSGSSSAETTDVESRTKETRDLQPESRSEFKPEVRPEDSSNLQSGFKLNLKVGSRIKETIELLSGSRSDVKSVSRSEPTRDVAPEESRHLNSGSGSETKALRLESTLDVQPETRSEDSGNLQSGTGSEDSSNLQSGSRSEDTSNLQSGSRSEDTSNLQSRSRSRSRSRSEDSSNLQSGTRSEDSSNLQSRSRSRSRSEDSSNLQSGSRSEDYSNLQSRSRSRSRSEDSSNLQSGSRSEDTSNLQSRSRSRSRSEDSSNLQSGTRSEDSSNLQSGSRSEDTSNLQSRSRSEDTSNLQSGFKLNLKIGSRIKDTMELLSGSRLDVKSVSRSEPTRDVAPEESRHLNSGSASETKELRLESTLDVQPETRSEDSSNLQSGIRSEDTSNLQSTSRSEDTSNLQSGIRSEDTSNLQSGSRSEDTSNLQSGTRSEDTSNLQSASRLDDTSNLQSRSRSEDTSNLQSGSRSEDSSNLQSGFKLNLKIGSRIKDTMELLSGTRLDVKSVSQSEPTRDVAPEEGRHLNSGSASETKELRLESTLDVQPGTRSEDSGNLQSGSRSEDSGNLQSGTGSEIEDVSLSEPSRKQEETKQHRAATTNATSGQVAGLESMLGNETPSEVDHTRRAFLANQRQRLLSSCEQLVDKIWSWVQQGSSVLSNSSDAGRQLFEAEDTLNTHQQLQTQTESAGHDAEIMTQVLDQIRALHTDSTSRTSPLPPSESSRLLSPLKALTEQLKRGSTGRQSRTGPPAADATASLSPELAGRVVLVLTELQNLKKKIDSNLQLLQPYVTFLRTAQQVEEEMEELREIYKRRLEEEEEEEEKQEEREAVSSNIRTISSFRSPVKKRQQVDACWQETLQRFLTAQELGDNYIHTVPMVSGAELNLQSVVSVVQQTLERISRTKQEVNELWTQQQIQIQQQQEYCRKYRERLLKTMQDLTCVSELLDSCTLMDLGSDLQTSKLLEHFSQARPHFKQLDAEVEYMEKSWETLRGVQDRLEVKGLKGRAVKEEDLSELLKLQKRVKDKIHQSESILDRTSSFHLTSQQLEALLQSDPASPLTGSTGSCGSSEADLSRCREEQQEKIQNLFNTASTLKTDICNAINHSGWTCFRVEQLEARLLSLDSLCVSWLNEAARREEKLRRELLTCRLNEDINQLRDSFKELKKRFSNLKFNYLKRNDRTRNMKAVRNQLQQVELYDEKLQALRKRLQGVTARLGSEVKDGGVAREAEDAINELQRQMGDFERSVSEHQKTLEMTRRLQQAMEEYQFWCEEASGTIARVGKFSSECRSTEAVSVLYRQFEKFVWPTVPQQEERISQIAELAVRLHGVEEGQRYIEKTVSKHSEMVESIRELSDGLMKLEAKLKLENLKKQQNDGETEIKEEGATERRREDVTEEKDEENEKNLKENRKMKKKEQMDNRSTQEAAEMYELKETGHTPELTAEHDGKEVPMKRESAAKRKPPLQKSRSQETDRQTENSHRQRSERSPSSYCSTHTFSLSCSPVEANRRIHAIHSQLLPVSTEPQATPPPSAIGPLFSDIQREFQRKETQEVGQQGVSASCGSNMTPLQDASAGGLSEAELQQQEVMTEDSLSNDEYECVSPDDISLPPLAETPESNIFQSDVEEGFCFSSHSAHINQYSHQCHSRSEHSGTGTGAARQRRESSRTESCPTPPTSLHSSTRFRSESSSFVQSPLAAPAPSLLTSTLCTILRTGETSTTNVPKSADRSLDGSELSFHSESNPLHKKDTPDSWSKDNNVLEKRIPSQSEPLLKEHNQPQRTDTQGKITQNVASKDETLPQADSIPQATEIHHSPTLSKSSYCPQPFNGPDRDLHKDKTPQQDTGFLKCSTIFTPTRTALCLLQSFPDSESGLHQDINSSQAKKEKPLVSKPQRNNLTNTSTNTISQQTICFQSSPSNSHHILPQSKSCLISPQENLLSQSETLSQIDPVSEARGFGQSPSLRDSVYHKDSGFLKSCATCPQTSTTNPQDSNLPQACLDSRSGLDQDVPSSQSSKETSSVSMPQSSSLTTATTVTQQTIHRQSFPPDSHCIVPQATSNLSSPQESPLSKRKTLLQINPVSQAREFAQSASLTDSGLHKDRTQDTEFLKSCATCPQTSTTIPQDSNLSKAYQDSRSSLVQDVPSSKTSKKTSSVSMPQSSSQTTATTVTQQTVHCQSSPPNSHYNVPQASSSLRSQQGSSFPQGNGGLPEVHVPVLPEPNSFSNISISSNTITSSHQTVYTLHESLTSSCTQQRVHDPGMTPSSPAKPTAPPQPESQTQALAQQANPHVTPLSSPPHLLTPDQDPNICQPMAIREEIRLTPQIQGPPLPAPPTLPQAKAESLPQGKASKPGPPCFTRPLSRATVMEGSPVMLEVEVTAHPEPTLTWFKDGEVSASSPSRALACEASDSDGGLNEARAADHHDVRRAAGNSSGDKWLVAEVFDIISVDWQTWFGTLCVLLWLIYLIVL